MNKQEILSRYFGYDRFRHGQEELIDAILRRQDVLGVMPTGAGKSLCYQVPALALEGLTLVISPLISLMKDQVDALVQAGIPAAYINSSLSEQQCADVYHLAAKGKYRILYVAPERLPSRFLLQLCQEIPIPLLAVDEAHCVSQWGQDFRPSYLAIADFVAGLPSRPVVAAFTATATERVRGDIAQLLALKNPHSLVTGFDRQNLWFGVEHPQDKKRALLRFIQLHEKESGIVYCATRKAVEEVCALLRAQGLAATRYHAGLPEEERRGNQEDFLYDRMPLMVATNAFGMGIDKSNVSFVLHYNMPKNMESYYQEAGRAGRDGEPAACLLFYGPQDFQTGRYLILKNRENDELDEESSRLRIQNELALLQSMADYANSTHCLRETLLAYFGESGTGPCGHCSNCQGDFEEIDITVEAQKILSCVIRLERRGRTVGKALVADVLRGGKSQRIRSLGLDSLPTYNIMPGQSSREIRVYIDALLEQGLLVQQGDEYPVLHPSQAALPFLQEGDSLTMRRLRPNAGAAPEGPAFAPGSDAGQSPADDALFEKLRALRGSIAKREGVPAYIVFSNATLRDMSRAQPLDEESFLSVSGVGQAKLSRYGDAFIRLIQEYRETQA